MASSKFLLYMFQDDHERIKSWVLRYPNLETGGSFFGLWTSDRNLVAHVVLGPGRDSRRTGVSFFQDVSYLGRVGNLLTHDYMLCHIGEWHSHHQLRLYEPSSGDVSTVVRNYPEGVCGFVLMIANIISETYVSLSPYLFTEQSRSRHFGARYETGEVIILDGASSFRNLVEIKKSVEEGKEIFKWQAPSTGSYGYARAPVHINKVSSDRRRMVQANAKPKEEQRNVHIKQSERVQHNSDQLSKQRHQDDKQQAATEAMEVCEDSGDENYQKNDMETKATEINSQPDREEEESTDLGKTDSHTSVQLKPHVSDMSALLDPEQKGIGNTSRKVVSAIGSATYPPNRASVTYQNRNESVVASHFIDQRTNPITTEPATYPPNTAIAEYQRNKSVVHSPFAEKNAILQLAGLDPLTSSHSTAAGAPEKLYPPNMASANCQRNERMVTSCSYEQDRNIQRDRLDPQRGSPSTAAGIPGQLSSNPTATGAVSYQHNMQNVQYRNESTSRSAEQDECPQRAGFDPLGARVTPSTATASPEQLYTSPTQWYSSARGQEDLKTIQQSLSTIADGAVGMTRDSVTHDLTMNFKHHGKTWIVEFSSNFPYSGTKLKQEMYDSYRHTYFNKTVKVISNCFISGVLNEVKDPVKLYCNKCSTHGTLTDWSRHR